MAESVSVHAGENNRSRSRSWPRRRAFSVATLNEKTPAELVKDSMAEDKFKFQTKLCKRHIQEESKAMTQLRDLEIDVEEIVRSILKKSDELENLRDRSRRKYAEIERQKRLNTLIYHDDGRCSSEQLELTK